MSTTSGLVDAFSYLVSESKHMTAAYHACELEMADGLRGRLVWCKWKGTPAEV